MTLETSNILFAHRRGAATLAGVSARFEPGFVAAIVGPNGAGKTTLLRLLAGVMAPGSGAVTLGGESVAAIPPRRRAGRIALVAQKPTIAGPYTVEEVVRLGRYALPRDERAVQAAIDRLELADLRGRVWSELSAGEQQRLAVARALAQIGATGKADRSPTRAILLDEPIAAIDPRHAVTTMTLLRDLAGAGVIVVVVLHDLTAAIAWCDHALVLANGAVVAAGESRATLRPELLERVYGTRFETIAGGGREAVIAVGRAEPPPTG